MDWAFSFEKDALSGAALDGNSGSCRLCGLSTSQHCKRCGDYYCSEKCQLVDWPNHRYICFPIPPLVRVRGQVHEDKIFNVKPPGVSENILIELRALVETIMKKLQRIENNMSDRNNQINGVKTNLDEMHYLDSTIDEPRAFESVHNGSQGSVTAQVNRPLDLPNGKCVLKTANMNGSRASLNDSQSESMVSTTQSEHVVLCTFRSTNRCAIRSKMPETESAYRAVLDYIDTYGRCAPPMKTLPKVGAYAITLKSNSTYMRVKIGSVLNEQKIRVMFCDTGNIVCRKLSDLREITEEIQKLPEYVTTVQLYGVKMTKYTEKIIEFLKSFERKEYKAKYIKDKDNENTHVELYDIKTNELLNDVVAKFCSENDESSKAKSAHRLHQPSLNFKQNHNTLISDTSTELSICSENDESSKAKSAHRLHQPSLNLKLNHNTLISDTSTELSTEPEDGRVMSPLFQTHIFSKNLSNVKAVVVDTDLIEYGYMACIQKTDMPNLLKVQNFLNTTELGKEPYEPKLEEYCIAKFENEWYRALVVNILDGGTKFEVSYIDFLNEATLTSDCIRPYPKDLTIDCYTTLCKIYGLPKKLTDKHREFLKSEIKINDAVIIHRVVEIIEEKVALIQCDDIINRMRAQNLI